MDITLKIGDRDLPLKLTMRRVRLIRDIVGLDLLAGATRGDLSDPLHVVGIVYALAGGSPARVGMTLEDFEDEVTPGDLGSYARLVARVLERDVAAVADEGNVTADAPA